MIERSKENQTFHNAEKVFNKLPLSIVEKSNYKIFCSMSFSIKIFRSNFFNGKRLTRIMYLWIIVMYQHHISLTFSLCHFKVSLPYKCSWDIMWITILSKKLFLLSFITNQGFRLESCVVLNVIFSFDFSPLSLPLTTTCGLILFYPKLATFAWFISDFNFLGLFAITSFNFLVLQKWNK